MTLLSLLQQTDMIGITPRSVIEDYPGKHLLAILPIQLEPRLPPYGLITRRNRVHSSAMQTFMASVHYRTGAAPGEVSGTSTNELIAASRLDL